MNDQIDPKTLSSVFTEGGVIAYPTEAVFGLGCDPDNEIALQKILDLKQRPANKGLILVAADYAQLLPYVNDALIPQERRFEIFSRWPGPVTWLLPKSQTVSLLLSGDSDKIAVRVTAFEPLRSLCRQLGKPIVSTSANPAGQQPAMTAGQVEDYFSGTLDWIESGDVQGNAQPSQIFDGFTGQQLR